MCKHFAHLYANKFKNLDEIDYFLGKHSLRKLTSLEMWGKNYTQFP